MTGLALALYLLLPGSARAQAAIDARITEVKGEVTLYTAENPDGVAAEADVPLEQGDRVVTGPGSSAEISLEGESVLSLSENSDFTLKDASRASTTLELTLGTLLAKIKKLAAGESLEVRSPTAVAAVRGTEFGVEVAEGQETHVGVFDEGKVEVSGQQGGSTVLEPNQETKVARGAAPERAYALRRLMARRVFMRKVMRARIARIRQRWKKMTPQQRQTARRRLRKMLQRRRQMRDRFQRLRERRQQRRQENP